MANGDRQLAAVIEGMANAIRTKNVNRGVGLLRTPL
jgi:hypothetical protein